MNEKISKIKLELLKEEFSKQIKDSYILNLSMVLLDEFEKLKQELNEQKDEFLKSEIEREHQTNLNLLKLIEMYEERINKAIKYIESKEMYNDDFDTEVYKLLKILRGEIK